MGIFDEMIYDFEMKRSRTLLSGNLAIIDNVNKLVMVSDESIVAGSGRDFTAVSGKGLVIKELSDKRMQIEGSIDKVEIYADREK